MLHLSIKNEHKLYFILHFQINNDIPLCTEMGDSELKSILIFFLALPPSESEIYNKIIINYYDNNYVSS